jgi:hypothetical protein
MRCPICDYNPELPSSVYHSGLSLKGKPQMWEDSKTGEITCSCLEDDVDLEYGLDVEEDE